MNAANSAYVCTLDNCESVMLKLTIGAEYSSPLIAFIILPTNPGKKFFSQKKRQIGLSSLSDILHKGNCLY